MSLSNRVSTFMVLLAIAGCTAQKPTLETHSHSHDSSHAHHHTPHAGVIAPFKSHKVQAGFSELKLHDDKGDLELWLTKNPDGTEPVDLPLDSVIKITFPNIDKKEIELHIRNSVKNEDEDGNGTIRNNKTNYFIFPGKTGSDASFLVGKDFTTDAIISFEVNGILFKTEQFELYPHTH